MDSVWTLCGLCGIDAERVDSVWTLMLTASGLFGSGGSRDIRTHSDLTRFRDETGATSVMIARAAQINPSVFREDGLLPSEDVVRAYLKYVSSQCFFVLFCYFEFFIIYFCTKQSCVVCWALY